MKQETTITFDIKYRNPDGSYQKNSQNSKFTQSITKTFDASTTEIKFPGWGNADTCIYKTGKHRIEVYIYDNLMHVNEFIVDLAPSEKLEKEITLVKKKLKEINQVKYLEPEIRLAENQMTEILKFQLFRGKSEKQRQIKDQQTKIDNLNENAIILKNNDIRLQEDKINNLKIELAAAKY